LLKISNEAVISQFYLTEDFGDALIRVDPVEYNGTSAAYPRLTQVAVY